MKDNDYYIECDGRIVTNEDNFFNGKHYYVRLRVLGGKGGMVSLYTKCGKVSETYVCP